MEARFQIAGRWVLAWMVLCHLPSVADAAGFPRGTGHYFNLVKIAFFLVGYLSWVKTINWVDRDANAMQIEAGIWNYLLLACGVLGLLLLWISPYFWLAWLAFVLLFTAPALFYVYTRNQTASPAERITAQRVWRKLEARLTGRMLKARSGKSHGTHEGPGVPVRFIGRGPDQQDLDPQRINRATQSKGYQGALEMIYQACKRRATDIHLEPTREEMTVRFRIDGMLTNYQPFGRSMGDAVINIFKVLSNLDITEKRKPQDGSFAAQVEDRIVDFRVATAGSVVGEKLVLRILDKSHQFLDLSQLGMRDKMRDQIHHLVTQPHGMFIVCGPTGAGKTTTLYACLNEIDRFQQNIITIEDPVEYQLDNITQIEVNQRAGKSFASELRSILRQDPDVILLGEIRDRETAEIACQAAQTGHMVFTTLHANDTVTAIGRLIDLGVQPFMIASALTAVLGQRLVRLLCPKCKVRYQPNQELLRKAGLPVDKIKYFYKPPDSHDGEQPGEVCSTCGGSGYLKRSGIFELLVVNERIQEMIRESPNLNAIRAEAVRSGMHYLYEDGVLKVIEGKTSIQELLRVSK
jgi:general secretion pathway protein E